MTGEGLARKVTRSQVSGEESGVPGGCVGRAFPAESTVSEHRGAGGLVHLLQEEQACVEGTREWERSLCRGGEGVELREGLFHNPDER